MRGRSTRGGVPPLLGPMLITLEGLYHPVEGREGKKEKNRSSPSHLMDLAVHTKLTLSACVPLADCEALDTQAQPPRGLVHSVLHTAQPHYPQHGISHSPEHLQG